MKTNDATALVRALAKNKYVLAVLCLGLLLLLLPRRSGGGSTEPAAGTGDPLSASGIPLDTESQRIASLLRQIRGVGEAEVLLSGNGAVVVCQGADLPSVRLDVTNAVAAYTGLGSDKISVIKMK